MGSFIRRAGSIGVTMLAATAPAAAQAQAHQAQVIRVACSSPALAMAINTANGLGSGTLRLASRCTYDLAVVLPTITGNVTLIGGPATSIRRSATAAAFTDLTVAATGTLRVMEISIVNGSGATGGGISNLGTVSLDFVTLSGNTSAAGGGAIDNLAGGRLTIAHSAISGNTATTNGGGIDNTGTADIFASRVSGDSATVNGGGVATEVAGITRIDQSTIDDNLATVSGGGISNAGTTSLLRTLVERNRAMVSGGGIFNLPPGTVTVRNSIIRANTPDNCFPLSSITGCVS